MAKTMADLEQSREVRKNVINKYGFVPTSVIEPDYSWGKDIIEYDKRKQQAVAVQKHKKMKYGAERTESGGITGASKEQLSKAFGMSSQNVRGKSGGLSTFPPALARFIVDFYSEPGDWVLDPCAGHNSRMQVTYQLERNYIGYDVSKEFMAFNREVEKEITGGGSQNILFTPKASIILREQSSEKMVEEDNSMDMIYTSPPYWDIEYYGEEKEQLGYGKTYAQFLEGITKVISECYRVLKKGKFCIFNINDFRNGGVFYAYHCDIMRIFSERGFFIQDVIIVKWQSSIGACFAGQIESRKITSKAHEYLICGRK